MESHGKGTGRHTKDAGSCGEIVLTQSPEYTSVSPGDTLDISCKASEGVSTSRLHWYQQKSGQPPKLLIYGTSNRHTGVPDRFSGSGSGSDYKLTIRGVTEEDAGGYYCQQYQSYPAWTFGRETMVEIKRRENAAPSALLFGPSKEEMDTGKATLVCMINGFYPRDAIVTWKEDNKEITAGVGQSENMKDTDNTYSRSSILSLTKDQFKGHNEYTCEVQHSALSSVLTTNLKTAEY